MRYEIEGTLKALRDGMCVLSNGELRPLAVIHHVSADPDDADKPCTLIVLTGKDRTVVADENPRPVTSARIMSLMDEPHFWRDVFCAALAGGKDEVVASGIATRAVEAARENRYL